MLLFLLSCTGVTEKSRDLDGDGFDAPDDCDDADPDVFPGAAEGCNGLDDDCDGAADEETETWYGDGDGDGYGDPADAIVSCGAPAGSTRAGDDCDDEDADVHPDAEEVCNEVDDDCDGAVDDEAVDASAWYGDADGDGDAGGEPTYTCDAPKGTSAVATDCDDEDAGIQTGAYEHCDGVDEDCDGETDEEPVDGSSWYPDADGDGLGDGTVEPVDACSAPGGYVADDTDCDDTDADLGAGSLIEDTAELHVDYSWSGSGGSTWFTLRTDGRFDVADGYTGDWTWDCRERRLDLNYDVGTVYTGTTDDERSFAGTMTNPSGQTGTWTGALQP